MKEVFCTCTTKNYRCSEENQHAWSLETTSEDRMTREQYNEYVRLAEISQKEDGSAFIIKEYTPAGYLPTNISYETIVEPQRWQHCFSNFREKTHRNRQV